MWANVPTDPARKALPSIRVVERGKEYCCCGPKGDEYLEGVLIECSTSYDPQPVSLMEVYRVKECACSVCTETESVIKGESRFFFSFLWRDPFKSSRSIHSIPTGSLFVKTCLKKDTFKGQRRLQLKESGYPIIILVLEAAVPRPWAASH